MRKRKCRGNVISSQCWLFNVVGLVTLMALEMTQAWLPLNPQKFANVPWALALNTAISFITNTNWQAYSGESTMSYLTQMAGLAVHNFVSAATGIAVLVAFARGLKRASSKTLGSFWVDPHPARRYTCCCHSPQSWPSCWSARSGAELEALRDHQVGRVVYDASAEDR